jgi:predicted O-methyltransferase YrrM
MAESLWTTLSAGGPLANRRIESVRSDFEAFFAANDALEGLQLAYLDGRHEEAFTQRAVDWLLPRMATEGLIILDDIHWSRGMTRAWRAVRRRPEIAASVDVFRLGLLFPHRRQAKEHFRLRPPLGHIDWF